MAVKEKFSLKDHLFNKAKVEKIAGEIFCVYPEFAQAQFTKKVLQKFPELELMERVYWLRDCLTEFLPNDYEVAVKILLESLPQPCDPALSDDDFGNFIYLPYSFFVVEHGCNEKYLEKSLSALKKMTTRFSVESPIRFFINDFPAETMLVLLKWTEDAHYHVRRLASEGTRPSLPWAKKIAISYKEPLQILNILYADKTRFVTRSVANHLNDISKLDPDLVIDTLKRWQNEGKQNEKELDFIIKHSLRTLVKAGNKAALSMLGYSDKDIRVSAIKILTPEVSIGQALEFSFSITSVGQKSQQLMIDYIMYFNKANRELAAKTHKIAKRELETDETLNLTKKHPLRIMTTRKLYPGLHKVELQINGQKFGAKSFKLVE